MKRAATVVAVIVLAVASPARAGDRECAATAEAGQLLRNAGKLVEAERELRSCSDAGCPKLVEADCRQWLAEVTQRLPSVVVTALDPDGREVMDVAVKVDDKSFAASLDGRPQSIDPGRHRITLERRGYANVEQEVTVKEGEKASALRLRFARPAQKAPVSSPPPSFVVPAVLGGIGVAGVATFFVYHFSAKSDLDALRADCAPGCGNDQVEAVDRKILISHLALGAGVTALLAAALVYLYPRLASGTTIGARSSVLTF